MTGEDARGVEDPLWYPGLRVDGGLLLAAPLRTLEVTLALGLIGSEGGLLSRACIRAKGEDARVGLVGEDGKPLPPPILAFGDMPT